jgi:hypothetical protein
MEATKRKPYRVYFASTPFRKEGTPVVGSAGSTVRRVVIIEGEEFHRLMTDFPALKDVKFEALELDPTVSDATGG